MVHIDERITKLPKWANDHIRNLMLKVEELQASLATHRGEKTRVRVDPRGSDDKPEYYARDAAQVSFLLGDDWQDFVDVRIEDQPDGSRQLRICGGRYINVQPGAANTCNIELRHD